MNHKNVAHSLRRFARRVDWVATGLIGSVTLFAGIGLTFGIIGGIRDSEDRAHKEGFRTSVTASWSDNESCDFHLKMNDEDYEQQWLDGCREGVEYVVSKVKR